MNRKERRALLKVGVVRPDDNITMLEETLERIGHDYGKEYPQTPGAKTAYLKKLVKTLTWIEKGGLDESPEEVVG